MDNLSEDDLNLKDMTDEELAAAWDHGVFVPLERIGNAVETEDRAD